MFTIDFTKPWLYKDIIYFNQGNLSTNNTLRCKLVTGGSDDFTGGSIACRFETKESPEINGLGKLIDAKNGIIDIVFPSNALIVGTNRLEILVNRADGGVAQSPPVMYDIWQGLTTGNGVEAETNYPILIQLINSTNEASNKANSALNKANSMITDITDAIDNAYRSANEADIATSNANAKIEEVETSKLEMIKKVDTSIANIKVETNTAIDNMVSKTDEKITDVNRAIAAGTKDLEVKEARKDANGVVHDTLDQRLKSDLIVGDKSLKDFVVDIQGLKESQDFAYETDKGYLVCKDTQNGVVKDLKVYGKSLVNKSYSRISNAQGSSEVVIDNDYITITNPTGYRFFRFITDYDFETSKEYTVIFDVIQNTQPKNSLMIETFDGTGVNSNDYSNFKIGINVALLRVSKENSKSIRIACTSASTNSVLKISKKVMILEGDHTQNPPSYFEGIASVGNGNGIEVLSVNQNLLDYKDFNFNDKIKLDGETVNIKSSDTSALRKNIFLPPNADLYIKASVVCSDAKVSFRGSKVLGSAHDIDLFYLHKDRMKQKFTVPSSGIVNLGYFSDPNGQGSISDIMISFDDVNYIPFKQDKKTILFKDTDNTWKPVTNLRGIDENNCDIIDSVNNKLDVKYIDKIVDGTENITIMKTKGTNTLFKVELNVALKPNAKILCDKYKTISYYDNFNNDVVGVSSYDLQSRTYIAISDISSTVEDFKNKLKINNLNLILEVNNPKSYEINPLFPNSFENETMILIDGGVIDPPANFKITSSLPNFVKNVDTRVKRMENDFYKYTVTQNRMQLGTTYSSDRTTFRVDTATFSTEKSKQDLDYDLFRLLKHNIIVGPQNYDKTEMENMMDFYVSVGKIDYNMWDELYMLIEEQHNPPVEEEAPVI